MSFKKQLEKFETDDGTIHPARLARYEDWGDPSNVEFIHPPQCSRCLHLSDRERWKCTAFPAGIPADILDGTFDHEKPFPGDQGIRFESV